MVSHHRRPRCRCSHVAHVIRRGTPHTTLRQLHRLSPDIREPNINAKDQPVRISYEFDFTDAIGQLDSFITQLVKIRTELHRLNGTNDKSFPEPIEEPAEQLALSPKHARFNYSLHSCPGCHAEPGELHVDEFDA